MRRLAIASLSIAVATTFSIALGSVPDARRVTNDTAIYQQLSEINGTKEPNPNFDADLNSLSKIESRYQEKLPSRVSKPLTKK